MGRFPGIVVLALGLAACGGASPQAEEPSGDRLAPTNLYPLARGNVWSYDVQQRGRELPTLGITRVVSAEGQRYEVSSNRSDPVLYEVREQGIFRPRKDVWLLKAPIQEGARWPSSRGMSAHVASTRVSVSTPAGAFEQCVRIEERGGKGLLGIATVYCPGVGPVLVEWEQRSDGGRTVSKAEARLRGYQLQ
jgi:hypothetical protein